MLSKRQFSCLSCEKGLVNVQSTPSDYYAWQRFPLKEPGDRISRISKGFSKLLSGVTVTSKESGLDGFDDYTK